MGSIIKRIQKIRAQVVSQTTSLVLLNLYFLRLRFLCVPALNCHSCPAAVFACPIGVVLNFVSLRIIPLVAIGILGLVGSIVGRFVCGWVCPFGLLQDFLHKIPSPKFTLPKWTKFVKYIVLVVTVVLVPLFIGLDTEAFFCKLCPAGTLESLIPRSLAEGNLGALARGWPRLAVLVLVLLFAIVSMRSFCKVFCPIGAFLAIWNKFSAFSLRYEQASCPGCKKCLKDCPMDIQLEDFRQKDAESVVTTPSECILCLQCVDTCDLSDMKFSFWNLWNKQPPSKTPKKVKPDE